jgi:predicted Zn-dependent protease
MTRRALSAMLAGVVMLAAAPPSPPQAEAGYSPQDLDERGLWMQMEEYERELKHSNFVMRDPALNAYVRGVFCKTVGEAECAPIRIYVMRTPYFNASMAPNGMMQVYSGLFLRTRNEAQLAAILGHEYTHFRNRHSIRLFRDIKKKAATATWLGVFGAIGSVAGLSVLGSYFEFSREMEAEADAGSMPLLEKAGYDPVQASLVWSQLRDEMDATAAARNKKSRKDKDRGMFATHPPTAERMATLKALAETATLPGPPDNREAAYRAALSPFWADLVEDQVQLNDFGGTEFLLASLAQSGWTAELLFARGELYRFRGRPEDLVQAAGFYRQATAKPGAPVEAQRGLGLALLRAGQTSDGQAALKSYLAQRPDAPDKTMLTMLAGE